MSEWISVKDRLPEPETKVLALTKNKHVVMAMYEDGTVWLDESDWIFEDTNSFEYDKKQEDCLIPESWWEWSLYNDDGENHQIGDFITHWMPLPELPEEVQR